MCVLFILRLTAHFEAISEVCWCLVVRGVAKPLWLGGCVHWIARTCYFYKIAQILLDALTTTNVATCDRVFHYFARIFPYFARIFQFLKNFRGCDSPPHPHPPVATPLLVVQWLAYACFTSATQVQFLLGAVRLYQIKIPPWLHVRKVFSVSTLQVSFRYCGLILF